MRRGTPINDYYKFKDKLKQSEQHPHDYREKSGIQIKSGRNEFRKN